MKIKHLIFGLLPVALLLASCGDDKKDEPSTPSLQNNERLAELQAGFTSQQRGGIADAGGFTLYQDDTFKYQLIIESGGISQVNPNNLIYSIVPYIGGEKAFRYQGSAQSGYTLWQTGNDGSMICGITDPFNDIAFEDFAKPCDFDDLLTRRDLSEGKIFAVSFLTGAGNRVWVKVRFDQLVTQSRQNDVVVTCQSYVPVAEEE